MKKINQLLFLFVGTACSFWGSCSYSDEEVKDTDLTVLWAPLNKHERTVFPHFDSLFESIDTIQLQQVGEESLLGVINDIKCKEDTLFLCSNNAIFIFNTKGEFIRNFKKRGRGRGEYLSITHFDINKTSREISILDIDGRKILVYSFEGEFLRQINMPDDIVFDFAQLNNGDYLCYCPKYYGRGNRGLWQVDPDGNFKKQLVELDDKFRYTYSIDRYLVHINEDQVGLMGSEDYDHFYQITEDTVITKYKMKTDIKIPARYKRTNDYPLDSPKAYAKVDYFETNDWLMFLLTNGADGVQLFYDKKAEKLMRFYEDDIYSIKRPEDIIPLMCTSYNGKIYYYYEASMIINNQYYSLLFPDVTENSNPVLFVCNPF